MWEFYLAASETAFRYSGMNNFQIQFTRSQHALPMTRNYMIYLRRNACARLTARVPG